MARVHVYISGMVQGVFFRVNTQRMAVRLGIRGWVRNLRDGRVEAVFEGEKDKVDEMLRWCRIGPEGAVILSVDFTEEPYTGEFQVFQIKYQ